MRVRAKPATLNLNLEIGFTNSARQQKGNKSKTEKYLEKFLQKNFVFLPVAYKQSTQNRRAPIYHTGPHMTFISVFL